MVEHRWNRPSLVGPIILIGIGVAFLLGNMGLLQINWWDLWRLWPVFLILAGLDIIARQGRWASILVTALSLALVAGLFCALVAQPGPLRPLFVGGGAAVANPVSEDLGEVRAVEVEIRMGAGRLRLAALEDSPRLLEGDLRYPQGRGGRPPLVSYSVSGQQGRLVLESQSRYVGMIPFGSAPGGDNWTVGLTRRIPLSINLDAGASMSVLDLRHLQLWDLRIKAGVGRLEVLFPAEDERMTARVQGGVGELLLRVPESVAARIIVEGGLGSHQFGERFVRQGERTYETPGYASATKRLEVSVEGGVGALRVE